jgi:hypothetical protein
MSLGKCAELSHMMWGLKVRQRCFKRAKEKEWVAGRKYWGWPELEWTCLIQTQAIQFLQIAVVAKQILPASHCVLPLNEKMVLTRIDVQRGFAWKGSRRFVWRRRNGFKYVTISLKSFQWPSEWRQKIPKFMLFIATLTKFFHSHLCSRGTPIKVSHLPSHSFTYWLSSCGLVSSRHRPLLTFKSFRVLLGLLLPVNFQLS